MKDILDLFFNLPIELRSKIVYSGYIVHPTAQLIKDLKRDIDFWNKCNINIDTMDYEEPSFYLLLKSLNYLDDIMMLYLNYDDLLEYILNNHIMV